MPYDLAKSLKEAGFQQMGVNYVYAPDLKEWDYSDMAAIPTLEELIEACGKYFRSLTLHTDGRWDAYIKTTFTNIEQHNFIGATPLEAVAKLWLALNRPNKTI